MSSRNTAATPEQHGLLFELWRYLSDPCRERIARGAGYAEARSVTAALAAVDRHGWDDAPRRLSRARFPELLRSTKEAFEPEPPEQTELKVEEDEPVTGGSDSETARRPIRRRRRRAPEAPHVTLPEIRALAGNLGDAVETHLRNGCLPALRGWLEDRLSDVRNLQEGLTGAEEVSS